MASNSIHPRTFTLTLTLIEYLVGGVKEGCPFPALKIGNVSFMAVSINEAPS
jgi:hypothetical protein